ncbi:formamidopyrimidine-DNA glycosylase [Salinibacillus kushneri]|uniref:Formamidopyrimidine-DNA glycosylase n=1 Tax=Salinibacillus kushneri TaxID=237682 RepID=A0A1I0H5X6_9BACI|nr:DNA-formamidopyrimidine glycosylase [Salinibacillus kushneri]SET79028.1 formamidopyrimidine-DNA glycosylase [Salinibacillus kushneri]
MPELPEVETVKKTLKQIVLGKTIQDVTIRWENIIQYPKEPEVFQEEIKGQTISNLGRKGKFLLFYLDHHVLISHLRMEGKYAIHEQNDSIDKHTHVIFHFTDGTELRYKDVRKFGTMHLYQKGEEYSLPPLSKLGPEPFDDTFTANYLFQKCQRTTRNIKNVLLDQTVVAGLGNIYVDEALFRSKIHPLTMASNLTKPECSVLAKEVESTLNDAIAAGGTTIRSYLNSLGEIGLFQLQLFAYGREGQKCKRCGHMIEKIKVGGRGTHICPNCQKQK